MADDKDQHEPSMEEILASIRRIISEDGDTPPDPALIPGAAPSPQPKTQPGSAPPPAAAATAVAANDDDDILVLTEEVASEEVATAIAAEAEAAEPPPLSDRPPAPAEPPRVPRAAPPPVTMPAAAATVSLDDQRLISDAAAAASLAALSELVTRNQNEPEIESMSMGQSDRTLEDITRELLRPLLKSWLDENLPQIVERIVRVEIGRLALDAQRR